MGFGSYEEAISLLEAEYSKILNDDLFAAGIDYAIDVLARAKSEEAAAHQKFIDEEGKYHAEEETEVDDPEA